MPATPAILPTGRTEKLSRLRQTIARRMVQSLQVSAQLTTVIEVDYSRVATARREMQEEVLGSCGVKLSFLAFIAKAALQTLASHPALNASIDIEKGEATYYDVINLAVAVDTQRGLLAPVIREADGLSVVALAKAIAITADRARSGNLMPDEMAGGTFTITNTGSRGALFDTPIINQPQVAILGTGAILERPVVRHEGDRRRLGIGLVGYLALSYDHRLVDGADAARYLSDLKQVLEASDWARPALVDR